jgi:hypothetical protein
VHICNSKNIKCAARSGLRGLLERLGETNKAMRTRGLMFLVYYEEQLYSSST